MKTFKQLKQLIGIDEHFYLTNDDINKISRLHYMTLIYCVDNKTKIPNEQKVFKDLVQKFRYVLLIVFSSQTTTGVTFHRPSTVNNQNGESYGLSDDMDMVVSVFESEGEVDVFLYRLNDMSFFAIREFLGKGKQPEIPVNCQTLVKQNEKLAAMQISLINNMKFIMDKIASLVKNSKELEENVGGLEKELPNLVSMKTIRKFTKDIHKSYFPFSIEGDLEKRKQKKIQDREDRQYMHAIQPKIKKSFF